MKTTTERWPCSRLRHTRHGPSRKTHLVRGGRGDRMAASAQGASAGRPTRNGRHGGHSLARKPPRGRYSSILYTSIVFELHGIKFQWSLTDKEFLQTTFGKLSIQIPTSLLVNLNMSIARYPQQYGQTKRVNQLEAYLRSMAFAQPKKWCSWLPLAKWWFNTTYLFILTWFNSTYHITTKFTPFQCLYGFPPPKIGEVSLTSPTNSDAQTFLRQKEHIQQQLKHNLIIA